MEIIPREARRITYSTQIRDLKKTLSLSDFQRAVVIGSILGDGHLSSNWSKTNYRLDIIQSNKQKAYVMWKYQILKDWTLSRPNYYLKNNSVRFRTVSHPELTALRGVFYNGKIKIIPQNILEFISPITLAVWFMDDGNIRRDNGKVYGYYLNTHSFTEQENHKLAKALQKRFGIRCLVLKNKGKHRLYIGTHRKLFASVIQDIVISSLQYKLS